MVDVQNDLDEPSSPPRASGTFADALNILRSQSRAHRILRIAGVVLTIFAVLASVGSFAIMAGISPVEPTPQVWTAIWIANIVLVVVVVALVLTELLMLVRARQQKLVGSRLRARLVFFFAVVAVFPALLVAFFAAFSLNQGLDQWFSDRSRQIVENSRLIARAYLQEHGQVLRDDIIGMATDLESARDTFEADRDTFLKVMTAIATTRSLPITSLVDETGNLLMSAEISLPGARPTPPASLLPEVQEGVPTLLSPGNTNMVGALIKLRGYENIYLFSARAVDPEVLEYLKLTEDNISDYRLYESNRLVFQLTFGLMYVGLAVIILLAALWAGMAIANRFVDPIRDLMVASNRVSKGRLNTSVPLDKKSGDLHDLSVRFNEMVGQLSQQRQALLDANDNNEKRRQFTEAVVEGVSAGVVGLDSFGAITLVNQRACEMFGQTDIEMLTQPIEDVVPQLLPMMDRARKTRHGQVRDHIELGAGNNARSYQVQLTREGTVAESKGFVITLDDITDLVSAQRNSAWADVARRIAHEIKNPLTPIQLSAERLRKRYAKKLTDDFDVFEKCVDTIIRQVGDIGKMVDEFSSFAQMPSAALSKGDIADIIRQSVFMESVRQPEIKVSAEIEEGPVWANIDARLIAQAITNLIKNAIEVFENIPKDKLDNPFVRISLEEEGEFVRINVSDNGIGWPQENRQRLLEPYMTTREKGTGLGLAIVAKIIEQHEGTVELRDELDDDGKVTGACFSFTLKAVATTKPAADEAASEETPQTDGDEPPTDELNSPDQTEAETPKADEREASPAEQVSKDGDTAEQETKTGDNTKQIMQEKAPKAKRNKKNNASKSTEPDVAE